MKKIKQWFQEIFEPEEFNDLDISSIADALNDSEIRRRWFLAMVAEIKQINIAVDRRLMSGQDYGLTDLCARRKGLQDALELVLSVKRQGKQEERPNPRAQVINLDRVTA